jgi:rare lipoprotein A
MRFVATLILSIAVILLSGCSSSSNDGLPHDYYSFNADNTPNAVPKVESRSKYGNPSSYEVLGKRYTVLKSAHCYHARGIASWYGTKFHKRLTSNREPYDMYAMTGANKVLPLPTYVRVHNLENGRTIIVRINDRGPFHENRVIDLSFAAAKKIGMTAKGTALVEVTAIDPAHPNQTCGTAKESATETPTKVERSKPQIYLQLGAFSLQQNAENLAQKVHAHVKRPVHVIIVETQAGPVYKVQIGPLKDVAETDSITQQIKEDGLGEAFAVVR